MLTQTLTAIWLYRLFRSVEAFPDNTAISQLLTAPATVGEVWIIGYLLIVGIRQHTSRGDIPNASGS